MAAACFLDLFFFGIEVQSVHFRPVFALVPFFVLEVVGAEDGSGEFNSMTKIGSPSSLNKFAMSTSQTGYLREGLTLAAKLASV